MARRREPRWLRSGWGQGRSAIETPCSRWSHPPGWMRHGGAPAVGTYYHIPQDSSSSWDYPLKYSPPV